MKNKRLFALLFVAIALGACFATREIFAARNVDAVDLANIRRVNRNVRIVAEFDPATGNLIALDCYRIQQLKQNGTVIQTRTINPVNLTAAELDAVATQIRNRLESIDAIADTKEVTAGINP